MGTTFRGGVHLSPRPTVFATRKMVIIHSPSPNNAVDLSHHAINHVANLTKSVETDEDSQPDLSGFVGVATCFNMC